MVVDTVMYTVHTAFAAVWVGSVVFVTLVVLPLAQQSELSPAAFGSVVSKLQWVTRISALLSFVTGGHLAGTQFTLGSLTGTTEGYLVVTMLALWIGLVAVIEIGSAKATRGIENEKVREPARNAKPFYRVGVVLGAGLLLVAGLIGTPTPFF